MSKSNEKFLGVSSGKVIISRTVIDPRPPQTVKASPSAIVAKPDIKPIAPPPVNEEKK